MERLFDEDVWEEDFTVSINGEKVSCGQTTLYADPDAMRPGDSMEKVRLTWPDGSAFKMQFHLSPAWWEGEYEGGACAFCGAVHNLIREGFDEDVPAERQPTNSRCQTTRC